MANEVVMPRQGNTVESCLIVEWRVSVGDVVAKGDVLCEIETDKSTIEVETEVSGTVLALLYDEGEDVPVLKPMLIVGEKGEDISSLVSSSDSPAESKSDEVPAEAPVDQKTEQPQASQAPVEHSFQASPANSREDGFVAISPRARAAAKERGVNYSGLQGSGPGGRIIEQDVIAFASANPAVSGAAQSAGASAGMTGSGIGGRIRSHEVGDAAAAPSAVRGSVAQSPGEVTQIKPSGIRKVIASRMLESLQTTAQFTLNASADARSIQAWRAKFKGSDESLGLKGITLGDMVVFAASRILPRFPELNAEYKEGIVYQHADVHLGLAVDTPRGLMVPVIRNADKKSLSQISRESKELAASCVAGNISPDLLSGATFTLSNLGNFGIESFTPVINSPQVAILGVCSIELKPVAVAGEFEFVPHMGFSMTIDHQVVDGAPAARFLKEFCVFLSQFELAAAM